MAKRSKVFSVNPAEPTDIAMGETGLAAEEPVTIGEVFRKTRDEYPDLAALCTKEGDTWNKITYSQYYNLCIRAAKSFLKVCVCVCVCVCVFAMHLWTNILSIFCYLIYILIVSL